jgi:hypothetical protein
MSCRDWSTRYVFAPCFTPSNPALKTASFAACAELHKLVDFGRGQCYGYIRGEIRERYGRRHDILKQLERIEQVQGFHVGDASKHPELEENMRSVGVECLSLLVSRYKHQFLRG